MEGLEIEAAGARRTSSAAEMPAWPPSPPAEKSLAPGTPRAPAGFPTLASCSSSEGGSSSSSSVSQRSCPQGSMSQAAFLEAMVQTNSPAFITVSLLLLAVGHSSLLQMSSLCACSSYMSIWSCQLLSANFAMLWGAQCMPDSCLSLHVQCTHCNGADCVTISPSKGDSRLPSASDQLLCAQDTPEQVQYHSSNFDYPQREVTSSWIAHGHQFLDTATLLLHLQFYSACIGRSLQLGLYHAGAGLSRGAAGVKSAQI